MSTPLATIRTREDAPPETPEDEKLYIYFHPGVRLPASLMQEMGVDALLEGPDHDQVGPYGLAWTPPVIKDAKDYPYFIAADGKITLGHKWVETETRYPHLRDDWRNFDPRPFTVSMICSKQTGMPYYWRAGEEVGEALGVSIV
jgi:hypothetical protein